MPEARTDVDAAFEAARRGEPAAEERWMGVVEIPIRRSLRWCAPGVDVEAVVQETLLRMMLVMRDPGRELRGENASLRFAIRMAANVAREEARRNRHDRLVNLEDIENRREVHLDPGPVSDPALRRIIRECLEALPPKPGQAIRARLLDGGRSPDRDLAAALHLKVNTFLQNIVRARRLLERCLEGRGVPPPEIPA